jgi:intracellular septation protein
MKLLFDFFPIVLFFAAYWLCDDPQQRIYVATAVAIIATFVQIGIVWLKHRRLEKTHLLTLGLIVVFGGATLILKDEIFIKWKPTVLNWLFAVAFLGSQFVGKQPLAQRMMGAQISLPEAVWKRLNLTWTAFFAFLGAANLYVVYHFDTEVWVSFKLFGMMGLTFAFIIAQAFYLARHMEPDDETQEHT